jgi:hypothetical protein
VKPGTVGGGVTTITPQPAFTVGASGAAGKTTKLLISVQAGVGVV